MPIEQLQTPLYASKKTHMLFFMPKNRCYVTTVYTSKKTPIYSSKKYPFIFIKTKLKIVHSQKTHLYNGNVTPLYKSKVHNVQNVHRIVTKRPYMSLKNRICILLCHIIGVMIRPYMLVRKRPYIPLRNSSIRALCMVTIRH